MTGSGDDKDVRFSREALAIDEDWGTLLPTSLKHLFVQKDDPFEKVFYDQVRHYAGIERPQDHFTLYQSEEWAIEQMASSPVTARFLQFLVRINRTKSVLEIGTFVGLSTLYMAEALPPSGRITTVEKYAPFAQLAQSNFEANRLDHLIRLIHDDAFVALDALAGGEKFDLIFIDGNKERYDEYLIKSMDLLSEGGLIVIDNVFVLGDALNAVPQTAKGNGGKRLLEKILTMTDWHRTFVPFHDGIFILQKRQG